VTELEARVRDRLVARRGELAELARTNRDLDLVELVERVDTALHDIDGGSWGICEVCHDHISERTLEADPLVRICLECLTTEARRALERDLEAAAKVQRQLLPARHGTVDGWEIAFLWEPLGAVSGDHVDLVRPSCEGEPHHLLLGDVAGKGVAASLLQTHLHALFRALAPGTAPLAELVGRANRIFAEATSAAAYATLATLRLHRDGRAEIANAGHPRPLLADRRGVRPVEGAGLPLGMFCDAKFVGHELRLAPGQTLLLYTDGWTEADREGEEYGIGRAAAAFRRGASLPLPELLAACRDDVDRFLGGSPRSDDLTLLAVRRTAAGPMEVR
jgi:sigma-B regulation protein RsbU (phosphoserine phosphatase)